MPELWHGGIAAAKGGAGMTAMRPVIAKAVAVCVAIAVAPWLTGGREPASVLVSGFALLLGSLLVWRQPEGRRLRWGVLTATFALLIGWAGLSLWWSASQYSTVIWIMQWVIMGLVFRLTYSISHDSVGRKWLVGLYLASAGVFAVVAVWMYLTSEYGRLTGTFYWANPAAAYLIPAIVLGIDGAGRAQGWRRRGWWGLAGFWLAAFWLTDSRAAAAVLVVVLGMYLLLVKLNKKFWIHFLITVVLSLGLSYGFVQLSKITVQHSAKVLPGSRLAEAAKGESTSGSDRLYFLSSALQMWFDHPLGGVGAGAYGDVHPQYQQRVVSAATSAHNSYVQMLAELGLVGAVLLAAMLLTLFLGSIRGLVRRPELIPAAMGVAGLLLHMGLDIDARYPALLGLVGMFLGLIYTQRKEEWVKVPWRWPVVAALALVPIVSWYLSESAAARGRVSQDNKDYDLAAREFGQAQRGFVVNPDYVGAEGINRLVMASSSSGHMAELTSALKLARRAEALDSHDGQHWQLEGRVLAYQGDLKSAEAALRHALELDKFNHPAYAYDLAQLLVHEQQSARALVVAQEMLARYPADVVSNRSADETLASTLANLEALAGGIELDAGRADEARAAAQRALKLDPKSFRGQLLKRAAEAPPVPASVQE